VGNYWGAYAYSSGGPQGQGSHYNAPQYGQVSFTPQPGGAGADNIDVINMKIMNQHPEFISALADEWQNAKNLLDAIKAQLLAESNTLYDEHWKSSIARDLFMQTGPGKTLAYLDEWLTATQSNVDALRTLSRVARESRTEMEHLYKEYKDKLEEAKHIGGWDKFWTGAKNGLLNQPQQSFEDLKNQAMQQVHDKQEEYDKRAQELAHRVGSRYFETFSKISGGHALPFYPPNAVLTMPGKKWPTLPGGAPRPGGPPAPRAPRPNAPPAPAVQPGPNGVPNPAQRVTQVRPTPPPVTSDLPAPGTAPTAPPAPGVVAPPAPVGALPPGVNPGAFRPTAPPVARPITATGNLAAPPLPGGQNAGVRAPGTLPSLGGATIRNPGATGGRAPGIPGAGPAGVRAPIPPAGRTIGRQSTRRPTAPGQEGEGFARPGLTAQPGHGQPGRGARQPTGLGRPSVEEPFTRSGLPTAPSVLDGKRPGGRRPGEPAEALPGARSTSVRANAASAGTAPPVLGRGRPGAPGTPGTPGAPRLPGLPGQATPGGAARKADPRERAPLPPGTEWTGVEAMRADATAPVLDGPAAPPTGAAVSGLEEVPRGLRNNRVTAVSRSVAARAGANPAELTARRTRRRVIEEPVEQRVEEANWTVETPGGGVLGGRDPEATPRQDPRPVLGAN
jgi:hypothetical protein